MCTPLEMECSCVVSSAASRLCVYSIMLCWSACDMVPVEERTVDVMSWKKGWLTMLWALAYPPMQVRCSTLIFSYLSSCRAWQNVFLWLPRFCLWWAWLPMLAFPCNLTCWKCTCFPHSAGSLWHRWQELQCPCTVFAACWCHMQIRWCGTWGSIGCRRLWQLVCFQVLWQCTITNVSMQWSIFLSVRHNWQNCHGVLWCK